MLFAEDMDGSNKILHYENEVNIINESDLNILYINIQSLRNKLDDLQVLIEGIERETNQSIHLIALSEIWIYENENIQFNLTNYDVYFQNRASNRSGGCCIYVKNEINSTLFKKFDHDGSSFLTIKLTNYDLFFTCVYRNCSSEINNFNVEFERNILNLKNVLVIGDMNINLKNNNDETNNYVNTIYSNGAICINNLNEKFFTRKSNTINTFIDHIITKKIDDEYKICLIDDPISDHRIILTSVKFESGKNEKSNGASMKNNFHRVFDYTGFERNKNEFSKICKLNNFSEFHNSLTEIIQKNTKTIKNKNKKVRNEWATEEFVNLIKKRNKYYKLKVKYCDNVNYVNLYIEFEKKSRKMKNFLKNKYYSELIQANVKDGRKLWKILNTLIFNRNEKNGKYKITQFNKL